MKPTPHLLSGSGELTLILLCVAGVGEKGAIQDDFLEEWRDPVNQGKRKRLTCWGKEGPGGQTHSLDVVPQVAGRGEGPGKGSGDGGRGIRACFRQDWM